MFKWLKEPKHRVRAATILLWLCVIGWIATHTVMLITTPAGASSWVFHVLLAISWIAIIITCIDVIVTTDVRKEIDGE